MKYKLDDVCIFINGGAWSDKEYVNKGLPVLKVTNCKSKGFELDDIDYLPISSSQLYAKNKLVKGDVVIATVGSHPNLVDSTAGRSCIVSSIVEGFYLNQNAVCIRTKDSNILDQKYLGYLTKYRLFQHYIQMRGKGAANQMRIAIGAIKSFEFDFPDIDTQRRIGNILSSYDALIEINQRQIKLLEEAAQRLYKEWFVNLRFPGYEDAQIVDGVPEGWKQSKVTELLEIKYGKDHKALEDGEIPVYGSGGVMRRVKQILYSGESVLIPRKGSLNNILYVDCDFWTIDTMFYSIPRMKDVAKYSYLYLITRDMYSFNIGAAVPSMTTKILDGMDILLPDETALAKFETAVSPLFEKKKLLEKQNGQLTEARDRLLPKLMSGEIEL